MPRFLSQCLGLSFVLLCGGVSRLQSVAAESPFSVKAGDVWVMAGDSITAQRLHSNFIEAFFRTRYPELKLQFRNSGIEGNTTSNVVARFDYDVAAHKPTIVSIELGMNDAASGDDPARYVNGMKNLLKLIRDAGATPLLISSSPVNNGSTMSDFKGDRCRRLHTYTEALKTLAAEEKVAVVDQFHPLLELWHANKEADGTTEKVVLGGKDGVHIGAIGQYTMAAEILKALNVDRDISFAALKADGTVVETKSCQISKAAAQGGVLTFTRLDERVPWPIHTKHRNVLQLMPEMADLSRYILRIEGLPNGDYSVLTNGKEAARVSAADLAKGWNMSTVEKGVIAERGDRILDLILHQQGTLNNAWRKASKEKNAEVLAEAQQALDASEASLAALCKPVAIQFEIRPTTK